jgi:hypothetical protein
MLFAELGSYLFLEHPKELLYKYLVFFLAAINIEQHGQM